MHFYCMVDRKICKVPIDDNVADPLTKPRPHSKHERHIRSMGIRYDVDWA